MDLELLTKARLTVIGGQSANNTTEVAMAAIAA